MNLTILVILYDCRLEDSKTLLSLFSCEKINNYKICIVNNGPSVLGDNFLFNFPNVELRQDCLDNRSLSIIYNEFISTYPSDYYVIFDHDTDISDSYFELLDDVLCKRLVKDVYLPIIYDNNIRYYPVTNGKVFSELAGEIGNARTIASGVIFSNEIVDKVSGCFGNVFDTRFYFYGVDSTFFFRLNHLGVTYYVTSSLNHSLSRNEKNEDSSYFRIKERSYDFGLTVRHYFSLMNLAKIIYFIFTKPFKVGKYKSLKISYVLDALVTGKHYKNKG
ncbi:hypothetical protein EXA21_09075 [Vibrio cincinnatiensis]|uniref:glycosyltransferase family 2 protein n=1 Tax=Vibrio cincinnatiensis TaxID=675 RepID=UPI001EDF6F28|nr:hypothetical protein [Vibrio cincinnatiensis]MCG3760579.1 hypothetical protein [Vibrio cincinnatiensis]MCG3763044.1 hypothetical protein [Vibrio cincinnatiensis]